MRGSVFKRCECIDQSRCSHSWYFKADLPRVAGKRRTVMRGGFRLKKQAEAALSESLTASGSGMSTYDGGQRLADWLDQWLEEKIAAGLRVTTARSYRMHIDRYLIPQIGDLRLRDVRPGHVQDLLATLGRPRDGRQLSPASVRRVHATLRSALATAKRRRMIPYNPAADVDLPSAPRPRVRPWEASELGAFLDFAANDRLGVLFEVIAASGLRRGEALGLRWDDVDMGRARLVVRRQVVQVDLAGRQDCPYCGRTHAEAAFGRPKTASGEDRIIDLDSSTLGALLGHRLAQEAERTAWGAAYSDHGLIFAKENGEPIPPQRVTERFRQLVVEAGLPRIRLHDLRHGQASLLLAAGVPMAVISKRLGHSSIAITSDTYSHLLEGVGRDAAQRAMDLVPRTRGTTPAGTRVAIGLQEAPETTQRLRPEDESAGQTGAPPGTRTPNPRIKSPLLCQLS